MCEKAAEMKQAELEDTEDYMQQLLEENLQTEDSKLPDPKSLTAYTNIFSDNSEFTFGDLYSYLVAIWWEETNIPAEENLRSFKMSCITMAIYTDLKIFGRADLMVLRLPFNVLLNNCSKNCALESLKLFGSPAFAFLATGAN